MLLIHANEVVSSDRLIDSLWGEEPPETAANTLQVYISQLRKVLEPGRARGEQHRALVTRPPGYLLRVEVDQLDLDRFAQSTEEAREALGEDRLALAAAKLREGLALWRGPALADFAFEEFAQMEIARLEELRLTAIEERVEADLALGHHGGLVGELEVLVAQHPSRERLRGQLMLGLYRSGRQAEALDAYQKTRQVLIEELGVEPSPALQRLEKAILNQEASLDPVGPPTQASPRPGSEGRIRAARKSVTVLFTDCTASTGSGKDIDPESLGRVLARYADAALRVLERHGGTCERLGGNTVTAVFGVPLVHEDDALRAVRAAAELREAFSGLNAELDRDWDVQLHVRIGVNTGEVVAGETSAGQPLVTGDAVNIAARLEQAAGRGEILIGEATRRLVRNAIDAEPVEPLAVTGKAKPVQAWRLVEVIHGAPAFARRFDSPLVGRDQELAKLREAFARAVEGRSAYLITVFGPAGIGKSRLANEFLSAVSEEAQTLQGRCLPYGEGITFWPLAEIVKQAAGEDPLHGLSELLAAVDDRDLVAERLAGAIGLRESAGAVDETFWAARKFLEALARHRPLVVVFEDVHWAEPTFLDFVEHLADWTLDAPVLLLCLARPELLEERPGWGAGKRNAGSIVLEPLSDLECTVLMRNLATNLAAEVSARLAEVAGGNPLFLEQMLVMLAENEHSRGELSVPPTLQALLAARLERLGPDERAVVEGASVVGKEFWRSAVSELSPAETRDSLGGHLQELVRREFIQPCRSTFAGEEALRFRHILIRDAAYAGIPKRIRSELHERFAGWLERTVREREGEYEEILGYHLEQAFHYHSELALADERGRTLAARAAERLASAGRRAFARDDVNAAASLLSRAVSLMADQNATRVDLLLYLGQALEGTGDLARANDVLTEAIEGAVSLGDQALEHRARLESVLLQWRTDPELTSDQVLRVAERAIHVFEQRADDSPLARAWMALAAGYHLRCRGAAADRALHHAIEHARRASADRLETHGLNYLVGSALCGPTPVQRGIPLCEAILARYPDRRHAVAKALLALAGFKAMEGSFEEARDLLVRQQAILRELGLVTQAAGSTEIAGFVEMLAGDPTAAEEKLRSAYETLEQMGEINDLVAVAGVLAQALHARGRHDEAMRLTEICEEGARDSVDAQVLWRATRARLLSVRGRLGEAESLAGEAVEIAGKTDWLNLHADALMSLGEVLRISGRLVEACQVIAQALRLYEGKGNVVSAARARAVLSDAAAAAKLESVPS